MPKILKIITNPNAKLRKKSAKISGKEILSLKFKELCFDMEKTMFKKDGVGLAAPQISKNIRLCVVNTGDGPIHLINPVIKKKSFRKEWGEEGCLSVPDVFGQVKRHKKVLCQYLDRNCEEVELEAEGLLARVIQHEIDHLDGILFIDKAKDIKKVSKI